MWYKNQLEKHNVTYLVLPSQVGCVAESKLPSCAWNSKTDTKAVCPRFVIPHIEPPCSNPFTALSFHCSSTNMAIIKKTTAIKWRTSCSASFKFGKSQFAHLITPPLWSHAYGLTPSPFILIYMYLFLIQRD